MCQTPIGTIIQRWSLGRTVRRSLSHVSFASIFCSPASPFASLDWGRCTRKGTTLYLHVFNWPSDGTLPVPLRNQVKGARLLADPSKPLTVSASSDGVRIRLPARAPDAIAMVVALQLAGEPQVIAASSASTLVR